MSSTFNRLLSGGLLRTLTLLITIVISFFMMPFMVENLGDKTYGLWVLIGSLMGYYMVVDFGLLSATQRYLARNLTNTSRLNSVINTAFYLLSILSVIAIVLTAIFWWIAPLLVSEPNVIPTMQMLIVIMGAKTVLTLPLMVFNGMLSAKLRFDIAAYIEIGKNILRTALMVGYLLNDYGIISLALITLLSELLAFFFITMCAIKLYPEASYGAQYIDKALAKDLFKFGKYTFIGETSNLLKFKVDDIVIAKYIGLASVTTYAIAFSLFNYAGQFINSLLGGLVTVFTTSINDGPEILRKRFLVFTEICALVATYFTLFMLLAGKSFIILWMGSEYSESFNILAIFCIILLVNSSTQACVPLFYALAKHKKLAFWNLYEGAINLTISIVLVHKYGITGVALGTLIPAIFFRLILQVNYACKLMDLSILKYWQVIVKHWLMGGVFYIAFTYIDLAPIMDSYIGLITFCGALSFAYILLVCRYFLSDTVKEILVNNLSNKIPVGILAVVFKHSPLDRGNI